PAASSAAAARITSITMKLSTRLRSEPAPAAKAARSRAPAFPLSVMLGGHGLVIMAGFRLPVAGGFRSRTTGCPNLASAQRLSCSCEQFRALRAAYRSLVARQLGLR